MCADWFLFLIDYRNEVDMWFVIKDFLENKVNRRSLFNIRIALFLNEILEFAFSSVILDDIFFALVKFILDNHINILIHSNNRNMVILWHLYDIAMTTPQCKVSVSFVSNIFIVDHWKEKGVPICASIIHLKSDI